MPRIALVQSDFNLDVTTAMAQAALRHAEELGAPVTHHIHVPGVYDVPLAAKALARLGDVDAIVVVGAVIQGETGHDTVVIGHCARKLADLAYEMEKPVGFGVTGPRMTREQAQARISAGSNAVDSVVKQYRLLRELVR